MGELLGLYIYEDDFVYSRQSYFIRDNIHVVLRKYISSVLPILVLFK